MEGLEEFAALVCPGGVQFEQGEPLRAAVVVGEANAVRSTVQVLSREDPEPTISQTVYSKVLTKADKPLVRVIAARDPKLAAIVANNGGGPVVFIVAVDVQTPKVLRGRLEAGLDLVKSVQDALGDQPVEGYAEKVDGGVKNGRASARIVLAVAGTGSEVVGKWEDESGWRDKEFELLSCEIRRFALRKCGRGAVSYLGDGKDKERDGLINVLLERKVKVRLGLTDLLVPGGWDSESFINSILELRGIDTSRDCLVDDLPDVSSFIIEQDPWQMEESTPEEMEPKDPVEDADDYVDVSDNQVFLKMLRERIAKTARANAMRTAATTAQDKSKAAPETDDEEDTQSFFKSLLSK